MRSLGQVVRGRVQPVQTAFAERPAGLLKGFFRRLDVALRQFVAVLLDELLGSVHEIIETVARLHFGEMGLVLSRVRVGFLLHPLRFVLAKAGRGSDGDLLLLVCGAILRRHVQDAVRVDVKRDLDLRHAAWRRGDPNQMEFAQTSVAICHRPLPLQDVNLDGSLVIRRRRKHFRLTCGNGRVARNQNSHHTPSVSTPSDSGVTSSRRMSFTSPPSTPPWMAAPTATTSSGFTPLCGSLPLNRFFTMSTTRGIRVEPPTRTTSSILSGETPLSLRACFTGPTVRCSRSSINCSSFDRVSFNCRCLGPDSLAVTNGRLISVSITCDSSILAFSAASFSR